MTDSLGLQLLKQGGVMAANGGLKARLGPAWVECGSLVLEGVGVWWSAEVAVTDRQGLEGGAFESKSRASECDTIRTDKLSPGIDGPGAAPAAVRLAG